MHPSTCSACNASGHQRAHFECFQIILIQFSLPADRPQGMFSDATLLDISEVELADIKFLEADPVVVVQFNCQQVGHIHCLSRSFSCVGRQDPGGGPRRCAFS